MPIVSLFAPNFCLFVLYLHRRCQRTLRIHVGLSLVGMPIVSLIAPNFCLFVLYLHRRCQRTLRIHVGLSLVVNHVSLRAFLIRQNSSCVQTTRFRDFLPSVEPVDHSSVLSTYCTGSLLSLLVPTYVARLVSAILNNRLLLSTTPGTLLIYFSHSSSHK
jgi:hypothetical protein